MVKSAMFSTELIKKDILMFIDGCKNTGQFFLIVGT